MLTRRRFLENSLRGTSLVALGSTVPGFLASTAHAAEKGQQNVLVVVELAGGNDGLNTVIPFADERYREARPTLAYARDEVLRVDDHVGLHPNLRGLESLLENDQLAIVQGVGYPNPNRSHFESMDKWQTADPTDRTGNGWLGRALADLQVRGSTIPAFHVGRGERPLALSGSALGVPTLNTEQPFGLDLIDSFHGHRPDHATDSGASPVEVPDVPPTPGEAGPAGARRQRPPRIQLIEDVARLAPAEGNPLLGFVRKTSLDTYASIDELTELLSEKITLPDGRYDFTNGRYQQLHSGLVYELQLVARMIAADFGTRIFYVQLDGFDTHGDQRDDHAGLMEQVGDAIGTFFGELAEAGHADRVALMTFSEFGRRIDENGSKGTDHGSGSCLFVAGPKVKGGALGEHPSLDPSKRDRGDLRWHTDFRRVYATLLDGWLGADSRHVLGDTFEPLDLLRA
jgi:uncharacterized protein (DUF1501 family)